MQSRGVTVSVFVPNRHGSAHAVTRRIGLRLFLRVGNKSVTQGNIHYTIYNPGGGIAPKSCLPATLKQQMKNKKKTLDRTSGGSDEDGVSALFDSGAVC